MQLKDLKGCFYSEGTEAFVISPNRWTKLFSWTWNFEIESFQGLKSCHICKGQKLLWRLKLQIEPDVTRFEPFKMWQFQNFKFRKIIWSSVCGYFITFWIKATLKYWFDHENQKSDRTYIDQSLNKECTTSSNLKPPLPTSCYQGCVNIYL